MVGSMAVYYKVSYIPIIIVEWLSMSSLLFRFEWHGPTLDIERRSRSYKINI